MGGWGTSLLWGGAMAKLYPHVFQYVIILCCSMYIRDMCFHGICRNHPLFVPVSNAIVFFYHWVFHSSLLGSKRPLRLLALNILKHRSFAAETFFPRSGYAPGFRSAGETEEKRMLFYSKRKQRWKISQATAKSKKIVLSRDWWVF